MAEVTAAESPTLICFGNSITHGFGVPCEQSFPALLERLLDVRVINAGQDGDTIAGALARVESDVLRYKPDLVTVELGANDYLGGVEARDAQRDLTSIIMRIQSAGCKIVVLSLGAELWGEEYEAMMRQVAEIRGCRFMTDLLEGIMDNNLMTLDGIHPNVTGYIVIARRVADFLVQNEMMKTS